MTVWTKQHKNVLVELEKTGRYLAKREYVKSDLDQHAGLVQEVYDWLAGHTPGREGRPEGAEYPIWVSLKEETTMLPSEGMVILTLEVDPALITLVNINKWGTILNYSYIPADERDAEAHRQLLSQYGVSNAKAYMSQFYPAIKRKIIDSWDRLFDASVLLGSEDAYGNIWEVRKEWVRNIQA